MNVQTVIDGMEEQIKRLEWAVTLLRGFAEIEPKAASAVPKVKHAKPVRRKTAKKRQHWTPEHRERFMATAARKRAEKANGQAGQPYPTESTTSESVNG